MAFTPLPQLLEALRQGKCIVIVDDEDRENEGDVICAAEHATLENVNFMATHAKGLICMPMSGDYCDKLGLTQMVEKNTDNHETAFTVSIDYVRTTTGISAVERSLTAIYVTHDQKEALSIADRLAVLRAGRVEQVGTPLEVFRKPVNQFVASFIGETNFLPPGFFGDRYAAPAGAKVLSIRPETIHFGTPHAGEPALTFSGVIHGSVYLGESAEHLMDVQLPDGSALTIKVFQLNPELLARDEKRTVSAWVSPADIIPLSE